MTSSPYDNEAFFHQLLHKAVSAGASDIHIKVGQPPGARSAAPQAAGSGPAP